MFPWLLSFSSPVWKWLRVSSQAFNNIGTVDMDRNDFLFLLSLLRIWIEEHFYYLNLLKNVYWYIVTQSEVSVKEKSKCISAHMWNLGKWY